MKCKNLVLVILLSCNTDLHVYDVANPCKGSEVAIRVMHLQDLNQLSVSPRPCLKNISSVS